MRPRLPKFILSIQPSWFCYVWISVSFLSVWCRYSISDLFASCRARSLLPRGEDSRVSARCCHLFPLWTLSRAYSSFHLSDAYDFYSPHAFSCSEAVTNVGLERTVCCLDSLVDGVVCSTDSNLSQNTIIALKTTIYNLSRFVDECLLWCSGQRYNCPFHCRQDDVWLLVLRPDMAYPSQC